MFRLSQSLVSLIFYLFQPYGHNVIFTSTFKDKNQPNGEKKTLKLTQRKTNQGNEINTRTCAKTQIKGYVCSPHNLRDAHRNMKIARNNSAVKLSN